MDKLLDQFDWEKINLLLVTWGGRIIVALLIFLIGWWISKRIVRGMTRVLESREFDGIMVVFLGNVLNTILLIAVIVAALGSAGIETTSLLAVMGAAGLAIGLALKDSLGNLASGVMIVALRPFREGDFVETADVSGTVTSVRLFQTTLTTPDNRRVVVPNSAVTTNSITNYTALPTRRIDLVVGVSYSDDLKVAQKTIARVLEQHTDILNEPEPTIMLLELGASSVDFAVRPWVKKEDYWRVRGELLEQLKAALEDAGCSIPFPQRDLHVYKHAIEESASAE
ncbi:MAG: small-conductance mechanosensitive channel MscS [Wenzhouxiangellaceae bacterium]